MHGPPLTADLDDCSCDALYPRVWPERWAVTPDVSVSNLGALFLKDHFPMDTLIALFQPARTERHALMRGALPRAMALHPLQAAPVVQAAPAARLLLVPAAPAMPAASVAPAGACA